MKEREEKYSKTAMVKAMEKDRKIYKMEYRLGGDRPLCQSKKSKLANLESSRRKALGARLDRAKVLRDNAKYDLQNMRFKFDDFTNEKLKPIELEFYQAEDDFEVITKQLDDAKDNQVSQQIIKNLENDFESTRSRLKLKESRYNKGREKVEELKRKIASQEDECVKLEEAAAKALRERFCDDTDEIFGPVRIDDVSDSDQDSENEESDNSDSEDCSDEEKEDNSDVSDEEDY